MAKRLSESGLGDVALHLETKLGLLVGHLLSAEFGQWKGEAV